jgi:molecular chaperone DnaJ
MGKDYYNILGVSKSASDDEVKKAFRKKAHEYHPDKKTGDEAKFKEINEAYQVLNNKQKRAQYDQFGSDYVNGQPQGGAGGFGGFSSGGVNINMDDLGDMFGGFGDMFGFGGGGRQGAGSREGEDMQLLVDIDFRDAVFGIEKEIGFRKRVKCAKCSGNGAEPGTKIETCQTCKGTGKVAKVQRTILGNMQVQAICDDCHGEGKKITKKCSDCHGVGSSEENVNIKVKIPAGISEGEVIRLTGQGGAGELGAPAGDLYLKVRIKDDARFERDEYDIRTKADIDFVQAALGDKIDVETVEGVVRLKIPAGTQTSTIFKLRGKGITKLRGSGRGDQLIEVIVKTPSSLSRKQKSLFQELNL